MLERPQGSRAASPSTPSSTPRTGDRSSPRFKACVEEETGKPFPQDANEQLWGAIGAVFGSWMYRARRDLSPAAQHPGGLGHRGQRPGDGVRQYGRDFGDRRRLHPQSLDRRPTSSTASSWSMRRARTSSPASARRRTSPRRPASRQQLEAPAMEEVMPEVFAELSKRSAHARRPLPRHAGHRIHRRARQAVDAADPHRQAHGAGGAQDRGRHGR